MDKPCWCGQSHSSTDVAERMQDHFTWRLYESAPLREKPQPPDWWPHQRKLKPGGGGY